MKRIAIVISRPEVLKLMFATNIISTLVKELSCEVDVFCPKSTVINRSQYGDIFNIRFFDNSRYYHRVKNNFLFRLLYLWKLHGYSSIDYPKHGHRFASLQEIKKDIFFRDSSIVRKYLIWYAISCPIFFIARCRILRIAIKWLDAILARQHCFGKEVIYDLAIAGSIGFAADAGLIWDLNKVSKIVVAVVKSWDNPSTKGLGYNSFASVISWSRAMTDDLIYFQDVDRKKIVECGVPHWLDYFDASVKDGETYKKTKQYLASISDNFSRPIIYLPSPTNKMYRSNVEVLERVCEDVANEKIKGNPVVLFRPHPGYWQKGKDKWEQAQSSEVESFRKLESQFDSLFIDWPSLDDSGLFVNMGSDSHAHLRCIFENSSCVISNYSTQAIEAAICGVPTLNISFGKYKSTQLSNSIISSFAHFRRVIEYGVVVEINHIDEMSHCINQHMGRKLRKEIVNKVIEMEARYGWKARKRWVDVIIKILDKS